MHNCAISEITIHMDTYCNSLFLFAIADLKIFRLCNVIQQIKKYRVTVLGKWSFVWPLMMMFPCWNLRLEWGFYQNPRFLPKSVVYSQKLQILQKLESWGLGLWLSKAFQAKDQNVWPYGPFTQSVSGYANANANTQMGTVLIDFAALALPLTLTLMLCVNSPNNKQ